jgi:hypothetical protein
VNGPVHVNTKVAKWERSRLQGVVLQGANPSDQSSLGLFQIEREGRTRRVAETQSLEPEEENSRQKRCCCLQPLVERRSKLRPEVGGGVGGSVRKGASLIDVTLGKRAWHALDEGRCWQA